MAFEEYLAQCMACSTLSAFLLSSLSMQMMTFSRESGGGVAERGTGQKVLDKN